VGGVRARSCQPEIERRCGNVGGRSDESAPVNGSPVVYTAGQGHDRMRVLDQISTLVSAAYGGWRAVVVGVRGAKEGSGLKR